MYQPLHLARDIRVFHLAYGPTGSSIEGSLRHYSLDTVPDFEALSYVWGTEQPLRKIICQGADLEVSDSLYVALERLRSSSNGKTRFIWADGICINQADKQERGHQVKIMDQIYQRAKHVQVWLGGRSSDSDIAMKFLVELIDQLRFLDRHKSKDARIGFGDHENFGLPSKDNVKWIALSRLLRRPWFTRAWVVQELAVGTDVRVSCGSHEVNWSYFESLYELSARFGLFLHRDVPELEGSDAAEAFALMYNIRRSVQQDAKLSLIKILRATRFLDSKWPQDKVFALLGLVADGADYTHHVDYAKHTVAETFQAVARTMVDKGHIFGILSQVRHPKRVKDLPSWVPDWSYDKSALRAGYPFHLHPSDCHAGQGSKNKYFEYSLGGPGNPKLTFPGCIVSSLQALSTTMQNLREGPAIVQHYANLDEECRNLAYGVPSYPTGESIDEAQWRTRIGNLSSKVQTADSSYGRSYAAWREYIHMALALERGETIDVQKFMRLDAESDAFATAQSQQIGGRKFAVTSDGHFGLVPAWSEVGDKVCIFMEAPTPFVVRASGSEWVFVGECYIHGLMNGEALRRSSFSFKNIALL